MDIQWYTWSIWVSVSEHLAQETLDLAVASDGTQGESYPGSQTLGAVF